MNFDDSEALAWDFRATRMSPPEDVKLPAANETDSESSSNIDASTEGICSAPTNVGLSGLDRHKMKKKCNQKAAKIAKRLTARPCRSSGATEEHRRSCRK